MYATIGDVFTFGYLDDPCPGPWMDCADVRARPWGSLASSHWENPILLLGGRKFWSALYA